MKLAELVEAKFQQLFHEQPTLVRSPGRVNLIGEHTDYNMGFVLPASINKAIYFAIRPREDKECRIFALDMNDEFHFAIDKLHPSPKVWPNYIMGVVEQLCKARNKFRGFDCVFGGDIPIGAGLSSSAAIEAGLAFALNYLFELKIDDMDLVKLAQKAENEFVGVRCGIMDQYINIFGERANVLRIDCRSLEYKYYPFDYHNVSIVLFNTGVSHSLASSEYNKRREECSAGVEIVRKSYPAVTHLRDVTMEMLNACKSEMSETIYRRCKFVVEEDNRLLNACVALDQKDLKSFGKLMYQAHEGLSKEYEVSCPELDFLVEMARCEPKIYGSRMMGGGFGGCTINLIENDEIQQIGANFAEEYGQKFDIDLKMYVTTISDGTSIISKKNHVTA
jgi:galactokinase